MFHVEQPMRLDIPWEALEGMLKGISAIDMSQMTIKTLEEAEQFVHNYGYSLQDEKDKAAVTAIQQEAVSFIQRQFLDKGIPWEEFGEEPLKLEMPDFLSADCDVRHLLIMASTSNSLEQRWACAVLKVMHIICHINHTILYRYFDAAKAQILARYEWALSHADNGDLYLGKVDGIQLKLAGFEVKDAKTRDSMILKLLCKRENVAEEIFDMIGVRIITYTQAEAILALELLRLNKVIIFPNIIPSRSRNTLIDFDEFKVQYQEAVEAYQWGHAGLNDTLTLIQNIATPMPQDGFNPKNASTLATYRSIHITERQLIRLKSPDGEEVTRFFFPYELQIVDQVSYEENHAGSSAHALYKQNQLIQARRRVLGPLFIALRKQHRRADQNLEPEPTP